MDDELDFVREARPIVRPPSDRVTQTERERLMAHIHAHDHAARARREHRARLRRRTAPLVAVGLLATAAAGWAIYPRGGMLDAPAFSGGSWQLTVGEESNKDGTYKVCHTFSPRNTSPTDGNGLGAAGCETSGGDAGASIITAASALETETGLVILVDLSRTPVSSVVVLPASGEPVTVAPFAMPQSREQFVAVEIEGAPASVTVQAVDARGTVMESRSVMDIPAG